ncbi:PTS sugar transporter subunit IIB [Abyssisolibacter fermentans]|uniref:PTS sugar transporter subunit IIB n=1 Tax=Abyssisolibacter fermentans TaxID=1766203 RepID=UPI000832F09E|nr:PTS sugar transporter subunit IIB [Abyssisolibacter fermentans]
MAKMRILLICGSGASSGFMAANMRKAAKKYGIDAEIEARSDTMLDDYIDKIDVLLVGPHLKFMETTLKEKCSKYNVPVAVIDNTTYGSLDGKRGLAIAQKTIKGTLNN